MRNFEAFGTKVDAESPLSINEKRILNKLKSETALKSGQYVVPTLRKSELILLDSLPFSSKRLVHLLKKFQRDQGYFERYQKNVDDYLKNGYDRRLTLNEVVKRTSKTWYLPHIGVVNINKPGKVQMVFEATGKSSNESFHSNLNLLNSLFGVLLRFYRFRMAIVADLEAMFHQVQLKTGVADAVRFLWKSSPESNAAPEHYQMLVHIF